MAPESSSTRSTPFPMVELKGCASEGYWQTDRSNGGVGCGFRLPAGVTRTGGRPGSSRLQSGNATGESSGLKQSTSTVCHRGRFAYTTSKIAIERHIQFENIDPRFAKDPPLLSLGLAGNQRDDRLPGNPTFASDPVDLKHGGSRTQIGVKPGTGGRHQVDRNVFPRRLPSSFRRPLRHLIGEAPVGRRQIGSARGQSIVADAS